MAIDPKRVKEIFLEAADLSDESARAACLDKACVGDAELRARVEALLRSHDPEGSFLGAPAAAAPDPDPAATAALTGTPEPVAAAAPTGDGENGLSDDEPLTFLAPPTRPDSLGRIGHYEVLQILGKGGFGIVFRAFDETLQRVVALKVMAPQLAATSPARKRFLREARSSAQVRHENVVQVYEVAEQPLPYLAMEFIPGETLQQRLDRVGPLDVPEVLRIGRQIAEGLAAAHAKDLIHRDVKPGNVLLEGGQQKVKITDFGLARTADDASISHSGIIAGTPMYMAPEQAQGQTLDQRADLFSLGSVLYQMVSGRPPFRANTTVAVLKRVAEDRPRAIREIIPETPQWLCDIIARLHAKDPDERYQSAREVADVLADCEAQLKSHSKPKDYNHIPRSQPQPSGPRPRFRIGRWAAAAAVLLLLLGGLGVTEATGVTDVHGTVIRLFSPEGTLVVEVDDPGVSVKIDGSDIVITGAGAKEIRLKPGNYTVEASKDGQLVSRELVTVTTNGKQVVRVSQEPTSVLKADAENKDPDRRAAEYVLSIGGTVRVDGNDRKIRAQSDLPPRTFRLTDVGLDGHMPVTDSGLAAFKGCKNMVVLDLYGPPDITDKGLAAFKDCKKLRVLRLHGTSVTDAGLALFNDCKDLENLDLWGCPQITDGACAPFKDCKNLTFLELGDTRVTDAGLGHVKDCKKLAVLWLEGTPVTDAGLADLVGLTELTYLNLTRTKVTAKAVEELAQALPKCKIEWDGGVVEPKVGVAPFTDADVQRIAALPAAQQIEEVRKELVRRNPGFDGALTPTIQESAVTGLVFETEHVRDISPVRACTKLKSITCNHPSSKRGILIDLSPLRGLPLTNVNIIQSPASDLTPLKGMALTQLSVERTQVWDLTPLRGMRLEDLTLFSTPVSDLTPLEGMPLRHLQLMGSQAADLSPLEGMPLESLYCAGLRVPDLSPLKGMPLQLLWCTSPLVSDLSPLKGMPLKNLGISHAQVSDLSPLTGMPLEQLNISDTRASDLSPLKGVPLQRLDIFGAAGVTDLTPLQGMTLEDIRLTPKNITKGLDMLRDMKSLKTIGIDKGQAWPAAEFWERYDKGEFKE